MPDGYGVRFDGGYEAGDDISQFYDNLIGKLVAWGRDRDTAIRRTLRALGEMDIRGVATTIPADVAILEHPDFRAATHSTKWVEETLYLSDVGSSTDPGDGADDEEPTVRKDISVEVDGKRFSVSIWVPEATPAAGRVPSRSKRSGARRGESGSGEVTVPMQGTIIKVLVAVGDTVEAGESVCVLEAMKMENTVAAGKSGTVTEVRVLPGDSVGSGDIVAVVD